MAESRQLQTYKELINIFGEYVDSYPATGFDRTFEAFLDVGLKSVPKDEKALDIIQYVLAEEKTNPAKIQKLTNVWFGDLPMRVRPVYKESRKRVVAFWNKEDKIHDKVMSLLNLEGENEGYWCDNEKNKVNLIEL